MIGAKQDWIGLDILCFMHPDTEEKIASVSLPIRKHNFRTASVLMSVSHETQAVTQDSQILANAIEWCGTIFSNTIQMQIRRSGISADVALKVSYTYSSAISELHEYIELEITPGSCVQIKSTKGQDYQSFRTDEEFQRKAAHCSSAPKLIELYKS